MDTETMARAILAAAREWREDVNYRLPYGLCKKYGIDVPPHTTPRGAWELLKSRGVIPEEEYRRLRERAGYTEKEGGKKIKERDWEDAEGSANTWQEPAWEGSAEETLKKHYSAEDGDAGTYAEVLEALHDDAEGAVKRAKEDGQFSEALESLIKQNAGWKGGPAVCAAMIPEEDWKDLDGRRRGGWLKDETRLNCRERTRGGARVWYRDAQSALEAIGAGEGAAGTGGERPCVFHVSAFRARAMALPDGKVCASKDVRYKWDGFLFDGDVPHVFLIEDTASYAPINWGGTTYNARRYREQYLPDLGAAAAGGPEPERLEPETFASAEEADRYMRENGHFYDGPISPGIGETTVCASGKVAFAGALAALEKRYGALDPASNSGNEVTVSCLSGRISDWESAPEVTCLPDSRETAAISLNGRWFHTENGFAALRERVREDSDSGIRMPCAEGMEAAYVAAEAYGECVKNLLLRKMGYACADDRSFLSGKERDTLFYRSPEESRAIEESVTEGEIMIWEDIIGIARVLQPDPDPELMLDPTWYPGEYTEDDPGWDWEEQGDPPGGELSRLKGDFFSECFANSVCGEPNVFGRAMAIYLDRCGIGRDGARGKAQEKA